MDVYTVRQGRRYRATISLSWFEQIASNEMVAEKLQDAGFADVRVTGDGRTREAEALWPGPDSTAELPSQVASIDEIEV